MLLSQRENLGTLLPGFSELGFMGFALMGWVVFPHGDPRSWVLRISVPNPAPNQLPLLRTRGRDEEQPPGGCPRSESRAQSVSVRHQPETISDFIPV